MVKYASNSQLFQFFLNSFSNFHHRGWESALFSSVSIWLAFFFGKNPNNMGKYGSRAQLFQFFLNCLWCHRRASNGYERGGAAGDLGTCQGNADLERCRTLESDLAVLREIPVCIPETQPDQTQWERIPNQGRLALKAQSGSREL